jgi:hypothetical protein
MDIKKKIKIFTYASVGLTTLSTLFLTVAFIRCFEFTEGYFTQGTSPILFSIFYFLGIATSFATALIINKKTIIYTTNDVGAIQIPQMLAAIAIFVAVLVGFLKFTSIILIWSFYGAFAFAIYILICNAKNGYKSSSTKIILTYASALFPIITMLLNNSNYMRHVNSVENILFSVFSMAFMTYILYEAKRLYEGTHSRWHFFSMLITLHTGIPLAVAYILAHFKNNFDDSIRLHQMIIVLIICITISLELARLIGNASFYSKKEWDELNSPIQEIEEIEEISETETEE